MFHVLVSCEWNEFGAWSTCTVACGGGSQSRTRSFKTEPQNGGTPCTGEPTEIQSCNTDPCPGMRYLQ